MDVFSLLTTCLTIAGVASLILTSRGKHRRGAASHGAERVRRGVGHAMLGLQEFVTPSVEYVFQAENGEQAEEDDERPSGDGPEVLLADLAACLRREPVDPEEVRRYLAAARRAGWDWRALFEQAVGNELASRPYRAPSLPPIWKVAPRD